MYDEKNEFIGLARLQELLELKQNEGDMSEMKLISIKKLTEILSNPVFKKLQGKRLYKEQKFLVSLPVKDTYAKKEGADPTLAALDGEEMIFQGAIDLLAVDENGDVEIIDYKFSKGNAEYLRTHYRPQLDLYKQAVAKIMRIPLQSIHCFIVNIYHGFQVKLD